MDRYEFTSPPEEFPYPAEYAAPPEEFPLPGRSAAQPRKKRGWKRQALYLATAAVVSGTLLFPNHIYFPAARAETAAAVTAAPVETAVPSETAAPVETATPVETEAPAETAAPTEALAPVYVEPDCDILYFSFSSEYHAQLLLHGAENILEARVEIWDPLTNTLEQEYKIPLEGSGAYELPVFDSGEIYFEHMDEYDAAGIWPDPELRVTLRYLDADGAEVERSYSRTASYEQGWGIRFWDADEPATEYSFPGSFALTTYEATESASVVIGGAAEAESGAIAVSAVIGGYTLTAEDCESFVREYSLYSIFAEFDPDADPADYPTEYQTVLLIPLPEGAAAHGTARFTVTQLLSDGTLWVSEVEIDY